MNIKDKYKMLGELLNRQCRSDFENGLCKNETAHKLNLLFQEDTQVVDLLKKLNNGEDIKTEYLESFEYEELENHLNSVLEEFKAINKALEEKYHENEKEIQDFIEQIVEGSK